MKYLTDCSASSELLLILTGTYELSEIFLDMLVFDMYFEFFR